jgi:iron complex transport system ATP-binding protein
MLELRKLSLILGGRRILDEVDLEIKPGRVTVLLGKNGSGKTSLLRCINRERPYLGDILLDGVNITLLSPKNRAQRVAYLPQLLPTAKITAGELALLGRMPHLGLLAISGEADRAAARAALSTVGLLDRTDERLTALSGGELRRAYLAMILAQEAPLLLLDEPTAHLDTDAKRELLSLISRLVREEGRTALLVLHDLNDAIRIADDIALLEAGKLVFFGARDAFLSEGLPERAFGLPPHRAEDDPLPFYY